MKKRLDCRRTDADRRWTGGQSEARHQHDSSDMSLVFLVMRAMTSKLGVDIAAAGGGYSSGLLRGQLQENCTANNNNVHCA